MAPNEIHILLLSQCLGFNRLAAGGVANQIPVNFADGLLLSLHGKRQSIIHVLLLDGISAHGKGQKLLQHTCRLPAFPGRTQDLNASVSWNHGNLKGLLYSFYIAVKLAEYIAFMLGRDIYHDLLNIQILPLLSAFLLFILQGFRRLLQNLRG